MEINEKALRYRVCPACAGDLWQKDWKPFAEYLAVS